MIFKDATLVVGGLSVPLEGSLQMSPASVPTDGFPTLDRQMSASFEMRPAIGMWVMLAELRSHALTHNILPAPGPS